MAGSGVITRSSQVETLAVGRVYTLIAMMITVIAAILRLYDLDGNGFSLDEVWSIWMAQKDPITIVQTILVERGDASPPTYYLLLHAFLAFGESSLAVRGLTIIVGTVIVWLTYCLGRDLFDARIGMLAALLVAMTPLHIAYSRTARAYILADLWELIALLFMARLLFGRPRRHDWIGFVLASALSVYTHYVLILPIMFQSAFVLLAWWKRSLPVEVRRHWILSHLLLFALLIPSVLFSARTNSTGQAWIGQPGIRAALRSLVLLTTGNPTPGADDPTILQGLFLLIVVSIGVVGIIRIVELARDGSNRIEMWRLTFIFGAFVVPWVLALALGEVRPLFKEKYLLFLVPPVAITISWSLMRLRHAWVSSIATAAMIVMTGWSLVGYYTHPISDQWREAAAYLRSRVRTNDLIVLSPGFFGRSYDYHAFGRVSDAAAELSHSPAVAIRGEQFALFDPAKGAEPNTIPGQLVWELSGGPDAPSDPTVSSWLGRNFRPISTRDFVGVHVALWQPKE